MKKIAVAIVNFNSGEKVVRLLNDLAEASRRLSLRFKLEVVMADNGSTDDSVGKIKNFKLIENRANLGFAKAANLAIKECLKNKELDRVLLLNPDVSFSTEALSSLLKSNADIAGPIIKFRSDGKWIYDFGGMVDLRIGKTRHRETDSLANGKKIFVSPPDYLSGCALLIKKDVFKKIGFFDGRYFLYFEDVDFCLRAKAAGFSIELEEGSIIQHDLVVGRKKPFRQQLQHLKSNYTFVISNIPWPGKISAFGYLFLLALKVLFNAVVR